MEKERLDKILEVEDGHLSVFVRGNRVHIDWQDKDNPNCMEVLELDSPKTFYFVQDGVTRDENGHFTCSNLVPVNLERNFDKLKGIHPDITKLIQIYLSGGAEYLAEHKKPYLFATEEEEEVSSEREIKCQLQNKQQKK